MNPYKYNRIPISSHGLHKFNFNFPVLSTCNFYDVTPVFAMDFRKGEKMSLKGHMFSRTNPTSMPALVTGRYHYSGYFVPYRYVWAPWYHFDQGEKFVNAAGSTVVFNQAPVFSLEDLSMALIQDTDLMVSVSSGADVICSYNASLEDYKFTPLGTRVFRILQGLGYTPSWLVNSKQEVAPVNYRNSLAIMCYFRIFNDYLLPKQFVGNNLYQEIEAFLTTDTSTSFDIYAAVGTLKKLTRAFYDNCLYDSMLDNPVAPNNGAGLPPYALTDISNNSSYNQVATNDPSSVSTPSDPNGKPSNGTPFIGGKLGSYVLQPSGVLTQYVLDALQSLNNFVKRHQLAGGHLLDRFLVSRGQKLDNSVVKKCFFCGEHDIELIIDAVENNSDTNLGELAGKGQGSTQNQPLQFDVDATDDGMFIVLQTVIPDSDIPVYDEPFNSCRYQLDFYHAEFDKLGMSPVKQFNVFMSMNGPANSVMSGKQSGFLNRYWYRLSQPVRLLGDYNLASRGGGSFSGALNAEHTFRRFDFNDIVTNQGLYTSFDFIQAKDADQYQRLFYSDEQDNFKVSIRWTGSRQIEKLPLGDSYDWDDDEFNRKVSVLANGNQS